MMIKQPSSDNAFVSLWRILTNTESMLKPCVNSNHNSTSILYISSLLISPDVSFKGEKLLDKISNLVTFSPRNCICLVRTTAPNNFLGPMKMRQQRTIDYLRDKCYVVVYSKKHEFLNHAKFLLHYHTCFSETCDFYKKIYHAKYFGSTNLTLLGLSKPRNNQGNYEEFTSNIEIKLGLNRYDKYYLNEVLDLISHKLRLFTDLEYLHLFISEHIESLKRFCNNARNTISRGFNPEFKELYEIYTESLLNYAQILALLDEIPGKKLTERYTKELIERKRPTIPFEIEMMLIETEYVDFNIKDLGLDIDTLYKLTKENIDAIEKAIKVLDAYLYTLHRRGVEGYMDDKEKTFVIFLKEYNQVHIKNLESMLRISKER
jgi:hypothetical protein